HQPTSSSQWCTCPRTTQRRLHDRTNTLGPAPTSTREPAGTSKAPAELTASTKIRPAPPSALRWASSTADSVRSKRTCLTSTDGPYVPSPAAGHTIMSSGRSLLGIGLKNRNYLTPLQQSPVPASSASAASRATSAPVVPSS